VGKDRVDDAVANDSCQLRAKDNQPGNDVPNTAYENYKADDAYHSSPPTGFENHTAYPNGHFAQYLLVPAALFSQHVQEFLVKRHDAPRRDFPTVLTPGDADGSFCPYLKVRTPKTVFRSNRHWCRIEFG